MSKSAPSRHRILTLIFYFIIFCEFAVIGYVFTVPRIVLKTIESYPQVLPNNKARVTQVFSPAPSPSPTPKPEILLLYSTYRSKKYGLAFEYATHEVIDSTLVSLGVTEIGNRIYVRDLSRAIDQTKDRYIEVIEKDPNISLFDAVSAYMKDKPSYCSVTDRTKNFYITVPPTRTSGFQYVTIFVNPSENGKIVDFNEQWRRFYECNGGVIGYYMQIQSNPEKMLFVKTFDPKPGFLSSNVFVNGFELHWDQTIRFE